MLQKRPGRKKQGSVTRGDYSKMRQSDFKAAAIAQERNKNKIEIRIDARTVILVDPERAHEFQAKARLDNAKKQENAFRVRFLIDFGWRQDGDGFWIKKGHPKCDLEAALSKQEYYQYRQKTYQTSEV